MAEFPDKGWTKSSINRLLLTQHLMQSAPKKHAAVLIDANLILIKQDNINGHIKLTKTILLPLLLLLLQY